MQRHQRLCWRVAVLESLKNDATERIFAVGRMVREELSVALDYKTGQAAFHSMIPDMVMSYMQIMNKKRAEADEKLAIAAFTEKWTLPAAPEIAYPLDLLWVAES